MQNFKLIRYKLINICKKTCMYGQNTSFYINFVEWEEKNG